jgi:hypothetical protein
MSNKRNVAIKGIRAIAKAEGFDFKIKKATHNGRRLFMLLDSESGRMIVDNYQFETAQDDSRNCFADVRDSRLT